MGACDAGEPAAATTVTETATAEAGRKVGEETAKSVGEEVVQKTREKYVEAFRLLSGRELQ